MSDNQTMKTQRITIRLSDKEAETLAKLVKSKQATASELFRAWLRSQK